MDKSFAVQGPAGLLECVLTQPTENPATVAIICHPHPLYGGSLHNKVVHTLMRTFRDLNVTSVRFNFRGVGNSVGQYDEGVGEVDDLMAVLDWVVNAYPHAIIWLSGFSFGAFIAAKSVNDCKTKIEQLVLVSPPVEKFNFSNIDFSTTLTCVVMGDQDEIVSPQAVAAWAHQHADIALLWLVNADHFFHSQLALLKETISAYLKKTHQHL